MESQRGIRSFPNWTEDGKKDEEYVTQYCGGLEDPRYEYEEGCDSIDIPYGTEKCYCRTELCNGAESSGGHALFLLFPLLASILSIFHN